MKHSTKIGISNMRWRTWGEDSKRTWNFCSSWAKPEPNCRVLICVSSSAHSPFFFRICVHKFSPLSKGPQAARSFAGLFLGSPLFFFFSFSSPASPSSTLTWGVEGAELLGVFGEICEGVTGAASRGAGHVLGPGKLTGGCIPSCARGANANRFDSLLNEQDQTLKKPTSNVNFKHCDANVEILQLWYICCSTIAALPWSTWTLFSSRVFP